MEENKKDYSDFFKPQNNDTNKDATQEQTSS